MDEFVGMIRMFVGDYPPPGYCFCDGSLRKFEGNIDNLYAVIGNTYGGVPGKTYALPDLRGRTLMGMGYGIGLTPRYLGEAEGQENVVLNFSQIPSHTHIYNALSGTREAKTPEGNFLGTSAGNFYSRQDAGDSLIPMNKGSIALSGGGQAHDNMPPFLCINFIICVEGVYPPRP